jgi:hypothetical protein
VRHPGAPRSVVVLDVSERLLLAMQAFHRFSKSSKRPTARRPGRPKAEVRAIKPKVGG